MTIRERPTMAEKDHNDWSLQNLLDSAGDVVGKVTKAVENKIVKPIEQQVERIKRSKAGRIATAVGKTFGPMIVDMLPEPFKSIALKSADGYRMVSEVWKYWDIIQKEPEQIITLFYKKYPEITKALLPPKIESAMRKNNLSLGDVYGFLNNVDKYKRNPDAAVQKYGKWTLKYLDRQGRGPGKPGKISQKMGGYGFN